MLLNESSLSVFSILWIRFFTITKSENCLPEILLITDRVSCKSIEEIAFAVIPVKAGIQKSLVLKNTGFPIKTFGNDE